MTALVGEAIDLDIMFEDTEVIVLNKPPGLVVHPAPGNWTGTLVNALIHHCGDSLRGIGGERRPGIVHRLDQYTSGVMVVAKTQSAHAALARQFADHNCRDLMQRKYHAVAWGSFERRSGLVDAPLGRAARNRLKRSVVAKDQRDAKRAVTRYAVLARLDGNGDGVADATLVECSLETGRTHQIRVHLAHIGHPVVGDSLYGRHMQTKTNTLADPARTVASRFHRQALHAASLAFTHPKSGKMMQFEASPPSDMMRLIAAFEKLD